MYHSTTHLPCGLGGLATRIGVALAIAALSACGDQSATGPDDLDPAIAPAAEAGIFDGGAAAELSNDESSAVAATVTAAATRLPRSFFVNPATGSDANGGTQLKPFKTLAKGLSIAIKGDTMRLAAGRYSAASNGERFTNASRQITVPAGVKIFGTLAGIGTTTLEAGPGDLVGLNLRGAATVRDLIVQLFPTGVKASQGAQTLKVVSLSHNQVGLDLAGSAKATLTSVSVFMGGLSGGRGAQLVQQAQLTMVGGVITASDPNCATSLRGVSLHDAARLTLKGGAAITHIMGTALEIRQTSTATLAEFAKIERDFTGFAGCVAFPAVDAGDSTTLTLKNAQVVSTNGGSATTGIFWGSRGLVTLDSAAVKGFSFFGLHSPGNLRLVAANTVFQRNNVGIGVTNGPSSSISLIGSTISNNVIGIHAPNIKLRRTLVSANQQTGVLLASASGNDLGQTFDLGHNLIAANGITGVAFDGQVNGGAFIPAAGNSWTPVTQGTNGSGLYPQMVVTGTSVNPPASGKNFTLPPNANFQIQL